MARIGVVTFQELGSHLAHDMLCGRYHVAIDGPVIGVVRASGTSDAFPESPTGNIITATHNPGDTTPEVTIIGFPNPTLVFFD